MRCSKKIGEIVFDKSFPSLIMCRALTQSLITGRDNLKHVLPPAYLTVYAFSYRPRKFLRRLMALNSLAHHLIPAPCMQRRPIPREIDSITTRALHLSPCPCVLGVPCPGITVNAISTRSRPRSKSRIATMLEYRSCVNILPRTTRKCHRKSSSFARFSRLLLFPFQRFVPGQSIKYNDSSFAFVFFFLLFSFFFDPRKCGCVRFFHSRLC